jgi:RNA polymerase sigma-70 factor, ECF subfamily
MNSAAVCLEELYRQVGPSLLGYLRRGFPDAQSAEDLLQDTFVQAARRPERLVRAASPRAWLFSIARNLAVTGLRRRRMAQPLPDAAPAGEPAEDPRLERMRAAIARLPDTLREPLELRLKCDLSYEEIAEVLEIPLGTVRSRLHNAVRWLRSEMTNAGD